MRGMVWPPSHVNIQVIIQIPYIAFLNVTKVLQASSQFGSAEYFSRRGQV